MGKKLLTLLAGFMALTASAETLDCTPNAANTGNSSGAYVENETQYEVGAYSFKVNNWNPTSGQIRGNQSSVTKNFYWFNATAIPNISKIEITLTSGTLDTTKISFVTGSSADNLSNTGVVSFADNVLTLTPSSSSDLFFKLAFSNKATSGAVKASMEASGFVITYTPGSVEPDTRNEVTLSWPEKQYDAVLENGFTAPTLSVDPEAAKGEVVYSSSDESVATVDANGAVTLVGTGLTTIKAAISDSETYKNASAEYALIVTTNKRENPFAVEFKKGANKDGSALSSTTKLSDVVLVGEQYVNAITGVNGTVAYNSTGGLKLGNSKNGATVSVTLDQPYVISKIVLGFAPYNVNDNGTVTVNSVEQNFSSSTAELVYEYTDKKSVDEIVIATGDKRAFISSVTVYYEEGNQASAELAFANNEYTAFLGAAFTSPKATTVSNGQITYASSNTDVATVDEQTGDVTVLAVGTTVITASVAETEEFYSGEAEYTLTVVDPDLLSVTFDFKNYNYGMERLSGTTSKYNADPCEFGSGVVSVLLKGENNSRLWSDGLRFYSGCKTMTVSVPAGYEIKSIDTNAIFTKDEENSTANSWVYACKVEKGNVAVNTMTVEYVATADVALSILIDGRDAHEMTYNEQTLVTLTAPKGATVYYVWVANDPEVQAEDNIDSYDWTEAPTNPYTMAVGSNKGNILKVRSSLTGNEIAQLLFQADGTTRIESVVADGAETPAEWFDLQGRRVAEPANGLYIRRQGRTATKVLVK